MIKIKTHLINKILKENTHYGQLLPNNKKINIHLVTDSITTLTTTTDYIREITYIDNLSRIQKFLGYTTETELYLNTINPNLTSYQTPYLLNNKYTKLTTILDNYRTKFDIYTEKSNLYNLTENILQNLRYTNHCVIDNNNTLCFKDKTEFIPLIDDEGNYTKELEYITYLKSKLTTKYSEVTEITKTKIDLPKLHPILTTLDIPTTSFNIQNLSPVKIPPSSLKNLEEFIASLGINNTRYIFSNKTIDKDIHIDIELALDKSQKNNCYYIEENYANICSIINKYKSKINHIDNFTTLNTTIAYNILNKLYEFNQVVELAYTTKEPYHIVKYIKELTDLSTIYLKEEQLKNNNNTYIQENLNLLLALKIVLTNALDLIGIIPKERL